MRGTVAKLGAACRDARLDGLRDAPAQPRPDRAPPREPSGTSTGADRSPGCRAGQDARDAEQACRFEAAAASAIFAKRSGADRVLRGLLGAFDHAGLAAAAVPVSRFSAPPIAAASACGAGRVGIRDRGLGLGRVPQRRSAEQHRQRQQIQRGRAASAIGWAPVSAAGRITRSPNSSRRRASFSSSITPRCCSRALSITSSAVTGRPLRFSRSAIVVLPSSNSSIAVRRFMPRCAFIVATCSRAATRSAGDSFDQSIAAPSSSISVVVRDENRPLAGERVRGLGAVLDAATALDCVRLVANARPLLPRRDLLLGHARRHRRRCGVVDRRGRASGLSRRRALDGCVRTPRRGPSRRPARRRRACGSARRPTSRSRRSP